MTLKERALKQLEERRDKLLNGGINSIPSPFKRFSSEFLGIEQGKYYVVTSSTKVGKSQLTSFLFLYTPLLYAYKHPDKMRLKVFYFPLEETPEDIMHRFMSYILFKLSNGAIRVSPTNLKSSDNSPISEDIISMLKNEECTKILDFFEETVEFSSSRNATGMYKEVKKYLEEHGTTHYKKQKVKNDFGQTIEVNAFDYYEPNDPDEYIIIIYDHVSLTIPEQGFSLKQSVDKVSEYFVLLRNRYKVSPVLIQQQSFELESLDAFKNNKLRPTAQGLSDSKYPSRDKAQIA